MNPDSEFLIPDPADDAAPYPRVEAWEPVRSGSPRRRVGKRSDMVRWATGRAGAHAGGGTFPDGWQQAQGMSFEYPCIPLELLPVRRGPAPLHTATAVSGAETTNLVSQSAFLKADLSIQVVTECTMSPIVQLLTGALMQKSDFSSARRQTGATSLPGLPSTGFSSAAATARPGASDFQHSAPSMLTAERLNGYGARWLQSLPVTVRPLITAKRHPHIVNKFAILWGEDEAVNAYFDELLISSRPGRRGFATEVLDELVELQRAVQEQRRY